MTPEELFSKDPDIDVKKKKRAKKYKPHVPTFAEQRAGGLAPTHNFTIWYERDGETRKKDIQHEINYIKNKIKTSVNFKKHHIRKSTSSAYIRLGYKTKVCNDCGILRGITFFDKLKDPKKGKDVRRPYCLMCRRRMNKEAYQRRKHNDTK